MSNIPKFRAWDSEANIMIYSDHRTRKLYDVYYGFEMNGKGELSALRKLTRAQQFQVLASFSEWGMSTAVS